jgi:hypothetical protein
MYYFATLLGDLSYIMLRLFWAFLSVMFAYEQCLLCLSHHPDIWIEAAMYLEQASKLLAEKGVCDIDDVILVELPILLNN